MQNSKVANTLRYDEARCDNCGMCSMVCPHGVFKPGDGVAVLARQDLCMECGACQRNCKTGAIYVNAGVGCAAAMFAAAIFGRKEACCC